jgi:hypothetical protein
VLAVLLALQGWAIVAAVGRQAEQVVVLLLRAETERTSQLVGLALAGDTSFDRATGRCRGGRSLVGWARVPSLPHHHGRGLGHRPRGR